jgi:hypothetical protein
MRSRARYAREARTFATTTTRDELTRHCRGSQIDCLILNAGKAQTQEQATVINADGFSAMCAFPPSPPTLLRPTLRRARALPAGP